MPVPPPPLSNQRMFNGAIHSNILADQLAARFNDRETRSHVEQNGDSAIVQIGSKHGTPLTIHMADLEGGVMVTMSRERDWLDRAGDAGELLERSANNPFSLLAAIPDILGEMRKDNLPTQIWNAVNDLMSLSRSLAGEASAPKNPVVCASCGTANSPDQKSCTMCGAPLPVVLPRVCPKCGQRFTSDALFCQSCGTRLIEG